MRLPAARSVAALTLALGTIGCGRPEPPAVSVRTPSVDADDIAVMRGVLDVLRRPHFLVVDTTLAPCPVHPPRTSLAFGERNRERLPLTGSLGADTTLISATVVDFLPSEDLVARYPQGTAVVTFSAPLYPAPGVAVIAYGLHQAHRLAAVARLERRADGRWKTGN